VPPPAEGATGSAPATPNAQPGHDGGEERPECDPAGEPSSVAPGPPEKPGQVVESGERSPLG
jgi:hypothetical protein